ncbi:MAG: OsmC family protein [Candidatus Aminicenantes bacterium]|jgi:putative redox protein|nr:OsmC family protein [Candidatus Aminicenantes bacterium]MDH5383779.1 OsmC family protein [Candidatus Aminicenantes bacterium]MDH5744758.1 OsmC family protein [Candidatus Aminicenantes bacterium]
MVEMRVTFPGGKRVEAEYKGFVIKTDQPVYAGGEGEAPAPFDLFLASIATCAGLYVLAFCQNRDIPMDGASVVMRMHKSAEKKMIEKIDIELQLPPEFPKKYERAVIRSVDSCAVKAHILDAPAFEIVAKYLP